MTFSTRNNPRLAQSGVALTSLGAVGGARGVSAGGLRVLIEFVTQYSGGQLKALENDLKRIERSQRAAENRTKARQRQIAKVESDLGQISIVRRKLSAANKKELDTIIALEQSRSKIDKADAAARATRLRTELAGLKGSGALRKNEIDLLLRTNELETRRTKLKGQQAGADQRQAQRAQQLLGIEQELAKIQLGRQTLGAKLSGLAIGAVGGIVGGAVLGVGFQLAEEAIAKIGDKLQDLIDPARHAREAIKDVAKEIDSLANAKGISSLDAAKEFLTNIGIDPRTESGGETARILAEATAVQKATEAFLEYKRVKDIERNSSSLEKELRKEITLEIYNEAKANGTLTRELIYTGEVIGKANTQRRYYIDGVILESVVQDRLNELLREYTDVGLQAANTSAIMAAAAEAAAAQLAVAAENIANAIQAAGNLQVSGIDTQIEGLGSGASARTKRLEAQLERAQSSGGGGSNRNSQLRNIAEERALILLRQRLRLLGTAINLEKYEGKFLLEAINAKINALRKQGDEQARVNRLLDLQYRMGQELQRNEGESIEDFLARRAQNERDLLQERDQLRREEQIANLEAMRDRVQDEVALAELAERRKEALRAGGTNNHIKNLQKQLAASKEADQKALEAKRKALQKEKEAIEEKVREAIRLTSAETLNQTALAIKGSNSVQKLNQLGGRIAGYQRAKATLQALVEGFGLPKEVAAPLLAKINGLLSAYGDQYDRLAKNTISRPGQAPIAFASGGVFELKNSRATFGQNVKTGEAGTEIGVILSNKVTQALRENQGINGQIGPFIIQKSDDPFRDRYAFKNVVKEAVEAALG